LTPTAPAHHAGMGMKEPGLDRHDWESRYAALEPELREEPHDAVPDLLDLVGQMLGECGYDVDEPATRAGEERDVLAEHLAARETVTLLDEGRDVGPGAVGEAIHGLRAVYDFLVAERSAP
jgi:hypothetical protein